MPGARLLLLGIAAGVVVVALVVGSAYQVLRDSFRQLRGSQHRDQTARPPAASRIRPSTDVRATQHTPRRTKLRWFSPEIVAVLLLALAAGLWLARLTG